MGPKRKRTESHGVSEFPIGESCKEKVLELFEKRFTYRLSSTVSQHLPEICDGEPWHVEELDRLKRELNSLKTRLNDKDLHVWHKHTSYTNIAGMVISELKRAYRVEMCTQAWSKCYEILSSFDLVDVDGSDFNSVHLCEAPGAFIAALNHFLITQDFDNKWQWLATTLNPYYEGNSLGPMINDDRFIHYTMKNWYFGHDDTGDLMEPQNLKGLQDAANKIGKISLMTADGSIDCQSVPAEQELVVSRLHWFEVLACLQILASGGSFVIKLFTMFEASTVCLMYLLCSCFRQVTVFKPATSKSGNSEVYVICQDYKTLDAAFLANFSQFLFSKESNIPLCIFKKDSIPEQFIEQHLKCCSFFYKLQSETIESNLQLFQSMTEESIVERDKMREYCVEVFVDKYNIRRIPGYFRVVSYMNKSDSQRFVLVQTSESQTCERLPSMHELRTWKSAGSFQDKLQHQQLTWQQQLEQMKPYDINLEDSLSLECQQTLTGDEVAMWKYTTGRRVDKIQNSRFCDGRLVDHMNELLLHSKIDEYLLKNMDDYQKSLFIELATCLRLICNKEKNIYYCDIDEGIVKHLQKELHCSPTFKKLPSCAELVSITESAPVCVLCVSASHRVHPELSSQHTFLTNVLEVLQHLPLASDVVMIVSSVFTRFTAGLLYILAASFQQVSISPQPGGLSLHQIVLLSNFSGIPSNLLAYLQLVQRQIDEGDPTCNKAVLEVLPVACIINDHVFSKWLLSVNRRLTVSFINSVIEYEKKALQPVQQE